MLPCLPDVKKWINKLTLVYFQFASTRYMSGAWRRAPASCITTYVKSKKTSPVSVNLSCLHALLLCSSRVGGRGWRGRGDIGGMNT